MRSVAKEAGGTTIMHMIIASPGDGRDFQAFKVQRTPQVLYQIRQTPNLGDLFSFYVFRNGSGPKADLMGRK